MRPRICLLNIPYSCANANLVRELEREVSVDVVDVPFPRRTALALKVRSFHPAISAWKRRYDASMDRAFKDCRIFRKRSRLAARAISQLERTPDFILQIGGLFSPGRNDIPYGTYNDFTTSLAMREYPPWAPFPNKRSAKRWLDCESELYSQAACIFTLSNHTRESMIHDYVISPDKVLTVGAGGNLAQQPKRTNGYDGRTIIFVGLDFSRKGGEALLEAFEMVKAARPDVRLIIIGPSLSKLPTGVICPGEIRDKAQLLDYYSKASLFVMPSLCEPFGFVFLEAMACGLPCIGTTADAMPEIISEGKTGRLVPPRSPKALAATIMGMLRSPAELEEMGRAARKRVHEHFTWKITAQRITQRVKELII